MTASVSATKSCEAGGFTVDRQGENAIARPAKTVESCLECSGTGLVRTMVEGNGRTYEVAAPCPRAKLAKRVELFNAAHIPAVHAGSMFENYKARVAEQNKAQHALRDFVMRWPQPRGFVLSGPVGTGKTHLLSAALRHLTLEAGVRCGYVEISLLYATIRRGFQQGKSGGEIIGPLSEVTVLAIDELGKGRGSAFELETLDELIARRYNSNKVTLFATNYSLKPPEEKQQRGYSETASLLESGKESKLLSERVGDRIYSRLCDMCDFVEFPFNTPDARRTPRITS